MSQLKGGAFGHMRMIQKANADDVTKASGRKKNPARG